MATHPDETVRPFLEGLLPDNPMVVEAWGRRFQVSPRNAFDLIKHVGEDCAGSFQFVRPDRLDLILSGKLDSLTKLSSAALERRMADLQSQSRAIAVQMEGRFSLAGAQTKDALHFRGGRWHVPAGRIPSTHILKPQPDEFEEHALRDTKSTRPKLAMKIGGTYRVTGIGPAQWRKWAAEAGLPPDRVMAVVSAWIERLSEALEPTIRRSTTCSARSIPTGLPPRSTPVWPSRARPSSP